jgi:hypothetical protein
VSATRRLVSEFGARDAAVRAKNDHAAATGTPAPTPTPKPTLDTAAFRDAEKVLADYRRTVEKLGSKALTAGVDELAAALNDLASFAANADLDASVTEPIERLQAALNGATLTELLGNPDDVKTFEELARLQEVVREASRQGVDTRRAEAALAEISARLFKEQAKAAKETEDAASGTAEALEDQTAELKEQERLLKERLDKIEDIADAISVSIRGAVDLGRAFGVVNEETAQVLDNLVQIVDSAGVLAKGIASGDIGSIIGGGIGVVGGIAGALGIGESAEEKAQRENMRANTIAVERLTREIGNLGANLSGNDFARAQSLTGEVVAGGTRVRKFSQEEIDLLERVADELGLAFDGSLDSYKRLAQGLAALELNRYTDSVAGSFQRLRDEFDLFDITDPIEQLARLRDTFRTSGGTIGFDPRTGKSTGAIPLTNDNALGRALASADLSSPEGRAALEAVLQQLFTQFQALQPNQIAGFLGDMTGQEFLDAIKQIEAVLDAAETGSSGQSVGFQVQRTITEVTGNRLAAYASTANVYAEQTARSTTAILELLQRVTGGAPVAGTVPYANYSGMSNYLATETSVARISSGNLQIG